MADPDRPGQYRDEPLDPVIWFAEARRLRKDLSRSDSHEARERMVRRAYYLSRLLPDPLWAIFTCSCPEEEFERLLENGPVDAAAERLVNPRLKASTISSGETFAVSVRFPEIGIGGRHVAGSSALGVVGAWLECIFAVEAKGWEQALRVSTDPHKSPAEQPPMSSEH